MVLQAALAVEPGATVPDIRQGVQRIADELVTDGLGRYDDNPRHRVSNLFVVTDRGRAAFSAIGREHATWILRDREHSARGRQPRERLEFGQSSLSNGAVGGRLR
jgi:hypothetical protein